MNQYIDLLLRRTGFSKMTSFDANWSQQSLFFDVGSAMVCVLMSDLMLQVLHDRRKAQQDQREWIYNIWRTVRLVVVTGILSAIGRSWYKFLDAVYVESTAKDVAAKVVLDELLMAPFVITSYIFALGLLEGNHLKNTHLKWRENFTMIYQVDLLVWPTIQLINVMLVPPYLRVPFINACTFLWNLYLVQALHAPPRSQVVKYMMKEKQQHELGSLSEEKEKREPVAVEFIVSDKFSISTK
ncbi:hypothetical protein EGW08_011275 [Elysia chlorotica]|uniref:Uncharacterized protein n=1 Tax=Elysia chlorotica TaxID=188477 RepID=A0A433TH93_ELYCH|nr:hypothetical protein EGW08_011275 [Elysia chlorotica]